MRFKQITLFIILVLFSAYETFAQCSQCKQAASATDENGNLVVGTGLNFGILYLLLMPFCFVAILGGVWLWRSRQAKLQLQQDL